MNRLLLNAKVYLNRDDFAEAVYISDGLIKDIGKSRELIRKYPGIEQLDCGGHTLIPGFNDSHLHFMQTGETMNQVAIDDVSSIDELITRCREFMAENPQQVRRPDRKSVV